MYEVKPLVPLISIAPVNAAFVALCHLLTVPEKPDTVNAATGSPEQMVWFELTDPPTAIGFTVTVNAVAASAGQEPDVTTAR